MEFIDIDNIFSIHNLLKAIFLDDDKLSKPISSDSDEYKIVKRILNINKNDHAYISDEDLYKKDIIKNQVKFTEKDTINNFRLRKITLSYNKKYDLENNIRQVSYANIYTVSNIIPDIEQYCTGRIHGTYYTDCMNEEKIHIPLDENINGFAETMYSFTDNANILNFIILPDIYKYSLKNYESFHLPDGKFDKKIEQTCLKADSNEYWIRYMKASYILIDILFMAELIYSNSDIHNIERKLSVHIFNNFTFTKKKKSIEYEIYGFPNEEDLIFNTFVPLLYSQLRYLVFKINNYNEKELDDITLSLYHDSVGIGTDKIIKDIEEDDFIIINSLCKISKLLYNKFINGNDYLEHPLESKISLMEKIGNVYINKNKLIKENTDNKKSSSKKALGNKFLRRIK